MHRLYIFAGFPALDHIVSSTDVTEQAAAAQALIYRVLPEHAANVTVMVDPSIGQKLKDTFTVGIELFGFRC